MSHIRGSIIYEVYFNKNTNKGFPLTVKINVVPCSILYKLAVPLQNCSEVLILIVIVCVVIVSKASDIKDLKEILSLHSKQRIVNFFLK